jgi:MinD superfamily P-loop ATPase
MDVPCYRDKPSVENERCNSCGKCFEICSNKAIYWNDITSPKGINQNKNQDAGIV